MQFPDVLPASVNVWATYIPYRTPEFKVHRSEGLANNAMGQRGPDESYAKYQLVSGEWVKVFEHHPAKNCAWCSAPLTGYRDRYLPPLSKKPKWQQPTICKQCYDTSYAQQRREAQELRERRELQRLQDKYKGV